METEATGPHSLATFFLPSDWTVLRERAATLQAKQAEYDRLSQALIAADRKLTFASSHAPADAIGAAKRYLGEAPALAAAAPTADRGELSSAVTGLRALQRQAEDDFQRERGNLRTELVKATIAAADRASRELLMVAHHYAGLWWTLHTAQGFLRYTVKSSTELVDLLNWEKVYLPGTKSPVLADLYRESLGRSSFDTPHLLDGKEDMKRSAPDAERDAFAAAVQAQLGLWPF